MRENKEDDILNFHLFLLFELFLLNAEVVLLCVLEVLVVFLGLCFCCAFGFMLLGLCFRCVLEVLVEFCGFVFLWVRVLVC